MPGLASRQVFHAYRPEPGPHRRAVRFCPRCGSACRRRVVGGRSRPSCRVCGFVQYDNPAPGVAVVVTREDTVLLGRRAAGSTFGGRWAFPAGFIELHEDFLSAARREVKEETGLEVVVTGIVNVTSNHFSERFHAVVVAVAGRAVGGRLCAGDDFCEVRWIPLSGRLPPLAYEADRRLLRTLRRGPLPLLPVDPRYARGPAKAHRYGVGSAAR